MPIFWKIKWDTNNPIDILAFIVLSLPCLILDTFSVKNLYVDQLIWMKKKIGNVPGLEVLRRTTVKV